MLLLSVILITKYNLLLYAMDTILHVYNVKNDDYVCNIVYFK